MIGTSDRAWYRSRYRWQSIVPLPDLSAGSGTGSGTGAKFSSGRVLERALVCCSPILTIYPVSQNKQVKISPSTLNYKLFKEETVLSIDYADVDTWKLEIELAFPIKMKTV